MSEKYEKHENYKNNNKNINNEINKKVPMPILDEKRIMPILSEEALLRKTSNLHITEPSIDEQKCAPGLSFENGSCIPLELLIKLVEGYNLHYEDKIPINSTLDTIYPNEYKLYLLNELQKKEGTDQKEWLKSKLTSLMSEEEKDMLNNVFRPDGPQGKFDWLSTVDINKTLSQYENKYENFKFLGAVPIDFMELKDLPFKNINFQELINNGKTRLGVIFNTDPSTKSGRHWISLFIDLKLGQIFFSDSFGSRPPEEVIQFMQLVEQFIKKNISNASSIDARYNKLQHQRGNSECGVYSINFILRLLKGHSFDDITTKRLSDKQVNKCRIIYFGNTN